MVNEMEQQTVSRKHQTRLLRTHQAQESGSLAPESYRTSDGKTTAAKPAAARSSDNAGLGSGRKRSSSEAFALDDPGSGRESKRRRIANVKATAKNSQLHPVTGKEEEEEAPFAAKSKERVEQEKAQTVGPVQQAETWKPSIVFGSPLFLPGEDLSRIDLAERKVAECRLRAEYYKGEPHFLSMLQEAIDERANLDNLDDENTKPISTLQSTRINAIQGRLDCLRDTLAESTFGPERRNIQAAIIGYETGVIPYSSSYTLIYGGIIVDSCPDYVSFTADREERLDRYYAAHGAGWLWYEPPLEGDGIGVDADGGAAASHIRALKGICLTNPAERLKKSFLMGHYEIRMGFRRRKSWVSRPAAAEAEAEETTEVDELHKARAKNGVKLPTAPDPTGPTVHFTMTLDSGATLPSLPKADLPKLGIQRDRYAAQTVHGKVATATSFERGVLFELDVGVFAPGDDATLVTASPPIWPSEPAMLGATLPVLVFQNQGSTIRTRLSGMLPFNVCYTSSAPGAFRMWLGEDRREVLGCARLPAGMRWSGWLAGESNRYSPKGTMPSGNPPWSLDLGTPQRITFEHPTPSGERKIWEEQAAAGHSEIWRAPRHMGQPDTMPKSGENVDHWVVEPRKQREQTEAEVKRQRKEPKQNAK